MIKEYRKQWHITFPNAGLQVADFYCISTAGSNGVGHPRIWHTTLKQGTDLGSWLLHFMTMTTEWY